MSFVASFFSCCFGSDDNEKAEAVIRHARIANIYAGSSGTPDEVIAAPPPCYADIARDTPFVPSDEKDATIFQPQPQYPPPARRASISSRSSIVSVPSTRLSDLTSMYTGTTHRRRIDDGDGDNMSEAGHSWMSRGWYGSQQGAPPSYYAGSERSVTPTLLSGSATTAPSISAPTPPPPSVHVHQPDFGAQHPVMQEGWLEGLRFQAETGRTLSVCNQRLPTT